MAQRDFNDTYLRVRERVYRLAAGIMGDRDDAEDIVQDLYEKLWHRRLLVVARQNPEGYILASARNMCLDRLRSRKPRTDVSDANLGTNQNEAAGHNGELEGIVKTLMAALPEKQRTAMHLRDVEGMEMEEIADVMGIAGTAVRMSLSRARATVKAKLVKIMNYGT